ncbi:unnamed protein product [Brachionus calyciflorus]|uniref:DNA-directed DNA polymerase n=1 Tax=Brachionus calyciflorus TaxID=104777 RepID=A0A814JP55_9BILA|nr:unnamed protein product [Brachionus calyciflorus]
MCSENEEIGYDDITSLYPFVQKYCNYPIAHPILVTENFDDVRKYLGMIKCKVLPPRQLYFPVYFWMLMKIQKNKGLRSVMKMLLKSFWGRFGMNTNKTQYKVISNPLEWIEMVSDDQNTIHNADFSHENYDQVFYSTNVEMHEGSSQTSVVLAAYVTSIIYVRSPGQYRQILGDYLGDFTDEIKMKGSSHIVEFISAGPKNYAYKMDNG